MYYNINWLDSSVRRASDSHTHGCGFKPHNCEPEIYLIPNIFKYLDCGSIEWTASP